MKSNISLDKSRKFRIKNRLWSYYYKIYKAFMVFRCKGEVYRYFCHWHNEAWGNERTVEIPVIWRLVKRHRGKKILEVGNVLSNYFPVTHDIIDKYEKAPNVLNEDIVSFRPLCKYDLIVSISTLEHVGWDEEEKNPRKILAVIQNLKNMLSPGGKIVVTLPLGYNCELDKLLEAGELNFDRKYCLQRISADNRWKEAGWVSRGDFKYNSPFPFSNWLVIGVIENARAY